MEFKKIQLNGFKSFAEKTNFLIEEGLTGIVGPNGCGKSNIVESLRWVMGETSAKSMRGSGMEDVIFSGTSNKASKNIAEVTVSVANKNNEGPLQLKDVDELSTAVKDLLCKYTKQIVMKTSKLDVKTAGVKHLIFKGATKPLGKKGEIYYDEEEGTLKFYNGNRWLTFKFI